MKIILTLILFILSFWISFWMIADLDVSIEKDTADMNETLDMTIRALDADGNVVDDHVWSVLMVIEGGGWFESVEFPSDWIYDFTLEDQWEVIFTKWLTFLESWEFTILVEDLMDPNISWTAQINISGWWSEYQFDVDIYSPANWGTETSSSINVIWETNAPNTIYEVFIDWEMVKEDITDENWAINTYIQNTYEWNVSMIVKLLDLDWNVVWESDEISFDYYPEDEEVFQSLEINPWNEVNQWDDIEFIVYTSDNVESVDLKLEWYQSYSMDKDSNGKFVRNIKIDDPWSYEIWLELMAMWNMEEYDNVDNINILEKKLIENVKFVKNKENNSVSFDWQYRGQIPKFMFTYANSQEDVMSENLRNEIIVDENETVLEWVNLDDDFYVIVYPLDQNDNVDWEESGLVVIEWSMMASPSCQVSWIKLRLEKINWKNYIVWDEIDWVDTYEIYMSENEVANISEMKKVADRKENKYEYPFDPDSEEEIYNWYSVVAKCSDWESFNIDGVTKVKVWPVTNIVLFLLFSVFIYMSYYIISYSRKN